MLENIISFLNDYSNIDACHIQNIFKNCTYKNEVLQKSLISSHGLTILKVDKIQQAFKLVQIENIKYLNLGQI